MDDIRRVLNTTERERSKSLLSDGTQSTGSRAVLLHRLHQLLTCIDDTDAETELHEKMSQSLDGAFSACAVSANKLRKKRFRWRTDRCLWCLAEILTFCFSIFLNVVQMSEGDAS